MREPLLNDFVVRGDMPLTEAELLDLQADAMADDVEIDLEKMSLWTAEQATAYFESGGTEEPSTGPAAPVAAPEAQQAEHSGPRALVPQV